MRAVTRHARYQALKTCVLRAGWHSLGDNPSERSPARSRGLHDAWERIGKLVYPMDGDYPDRRAKHE